MVSTSNDGIMTEYLVKYGALKTSDKARPTEWLETLYMTDCYRAGKELGHARAHYDMAIWNGVSSAEIDKRLHDLAHFMAELAQDRMASWGIKH